ncbi:hypothetical protein NS183_04910, partial [Microbacterium testaceum]|uniref:hypothetical protein n=1 Tax=Microbacterium testaceum TaxID=2033 RepID=UPI0007927F5E
VLAVARGVVDGLGVASAGARVWPWTEAVAYRTGALWRVGPGGGVMAGGARDGTGPASDLITITVSLARAAAIAAAGEALLRVRGR